MQPMEDFVGSAQRLSADSESAGRRKRGRADQSLAPTHRCLLALLRLGIGCGTGTLPEIPWACWPDLYCLAWEHGVGALCFDGARCMPKGKELVTIYKMVVLKKGRLGPMHILNQIRVLCLRGIRLPFREKLNFSEKIPERIYLVLN